MGKERNTSQVPYGIQQFSASELTALQNIQTTWQVDGEHDSLIHRETEHTYFERYPGYIEERFEELMRNSRAKIENMSSPSMDYARQIAEIEELREELYGVLPGARPKPGEKEDRAYDIVKDVWRERKLREGIDLLPPEEKEMKWDMFRQYLELQNRTYLGEDCNVHDKTTIYSFRNGFMYMDKLSTITPFVEIIAFGVALAEHDGSLDLQDEILELKGVIQMEEFGLFGNGKYIMFSLHGETHGTKYNRDYIDIGEKIVDTKEEINLAVTRFKTPHAYKEAQSIALQENKNYFDGFDVQSMSRRGWLLSHFIFPEEQGTVHELYNKKFRRHADAMDESDFMRQIYVECYPLIKAYIDLICNSASWEEIAEANCAITNKSTRLYKERKRTQFRYSDIDFSNNNWQLNMVAAGVSERSAWGRQKVEAGGGACGSKKGYGLDLGLNLESDYLSLTIENLLMSNSVVQLSLESLSVGEDEHGSLKAQCPDCKKWWTREPKGWIFVCDKEKGGCGSKKISCGKTESGQIIMNAQTKITIEQLADREKAKASKEDNKPTGKIESVKKVSVNPTIVSFAILESVVFAKKMLREQEEKQKELVHI